MTPDTLKSVNWIRYYGNDFFMSSVVYSDLAIGLAKKNYFEMTPDTLKSVQ